MEIQCRNCNARYQVENAKIPDKGAYVRCKKCQTRFLIQKETKAKNSESGKALKSNTSAQEQSVDLYIEQGNQEEAVKLLCELITRCAMEKNFVKAETLKDKLYEVAPLALTEIVKVGEIIGEEKRKSMDQGYLEVWADLNESLEPDETIELYYSMNELTLKPGDLVFKQGQHNSNLYFVQEGLLKLFYSDPTEQKEIVLRELSTGDIANVTSFYSSTICTHSLAAVTETKLTYLGKDILRKWEEEFPGIERELNRFCQRQDTIRDLIQKGELHRRDYKRAKISSQATIQLLDNLGQPQPVKRAFKVILLDISVGGVSYTVNLNKREKADRLLGQSLILQIDFATSTGEQKIIQKGKIVAVNLFPFDEASVHVRFHTPLDEKMIETIRS